MRPHEDQYSKSSVGEALEISRSGCYNVRTERVGPRAEEDSQPREQVVRVHHQSRGNYGSPWVHLKLGKQGHRCSRKQVARFRLP